MINEISGCEEFWSFVVQNAYWDITY